ncbi:MAG: hypothetical protein ACE14Q_08810 [Acidobacteriota bacterium]
MFKKILFVLFAFLFLSNFMAQEKSADEPGILWFQGALDKEQYILWLHFEQYLNNPKEIKAIKVTFEPSGTVAALIYDENTPDEEVQTLLEGKEALSLLKTDSFLTLNPVIYYYPKAKYLAEEKSVKIEYYLQDENGEYKFIDGGEFSFDRPASPKIDESLQE